MQVGHQSPHLTCWHVCLCASQETVLLEWVNPIYLDISYQEQIQEEFEESSEIQLKDFLRVSSYSFIFCMCQRAFFWLTLCLSAGGEVQGGERSTATLSASVDKEGSI